MMVVCVVQESGMHCGPDSEIRGQRCEFSPSTFLWIWEIKHGCQACLASALACLIILSDALFIVSIYVHTHKTVYLGLNTIYSLRYLLEVLRYTAQEHQCL